MKHLIIFSLYSGLFLFYLNSSNTYSVEPSLSGDVTSCVRGTFTAYGSTSWTTITIIFKNICSSDIDFQNSLITFINKTKISSTASGTFTSLSYPDTQPKFTSELLSSGAYLASLRLHFPTQPWANSKLHPGHSFNIRYGAPTGDYDEASLKIYIAKSQVN